MKITENDLRKLVNEAVKKKLQEASDTAEPGTVVPSAKSVVAFSKKFDDLVTKMIEDVRTLADEGEALIESNLTNHPEVGTRNELLIGKIGILRAIANSLATTFERVRRYIGA